MDTSSGGTCRPARSCSISILFLASGLLGAVACDGITDPPGASESAVAIDQTDMSRPELVVLRMDGTDVRTLVAPAVDPGAHLRLTRPRWLPSGDEILYEIGDAENSTIRITDLEGRTRPLFAAGAAPTVRQFHPVVAEAGPWIYFIGDAGVHEPFEPLEVWRVRPNGSGAERIRELDREAATDLYDVSRDGRTLLIGRGSVLLRMDAVTGDTTRLGPAVHDARFSPDGSLIAYSDMDGTQVFVMRADGTGARRISYPSVHTWYEAGLTWTDDGAWVIARAIGGLHRIRVDDGTTTPLSWGGPYWEPDLRPRPR